MPHNAPVMKTAIQAKAGALLRFATSQGITLAGNLLYGLLCVRLLTTAEYAKFVVVFGLQGTLLVLMDINFSGTLIPLVGERFQDRRLIADFVASIRQLSRWLFVVVAIGTVFAYPWLVKRRGWTWHTIAAMLALLLLSTWCYRIGSTYGTVLILLRDRKRWYRGQMVSSLGTLALLAIVWAVGLLNGMVAVTINIVGNIFVGAYYYYCARQQLGRAGQRSADKQRSIVHLALPNIPQAIFYAFQGQISLFLITYLGHTSGVAGVGALGRLGQIFSLLSQVNPILVEPYFAKLRKQQVLRRYFVAVAILSGVCAVILLIGVRFPDVFLTLLGPQYEGLRMEVRLSIMAAAISCVSGLIWCINSSRRFVYWWNVTLSITLTIVVQAVTILTNDMGTVKGVLILSLATNTSWLLVNIVSSVYGFIWGPRQVEFEPNLLREEVRIVEDEGASGALGLTNTPETS